MLSVKGKRLLLQGASRGNLGLIKTAKQNGVYVVMTGMGGDFPCNPYADKFCYADISDPDAVLKVAQEEKVDGAIICCSDTGLRGVGRINDVMGLTGLTEEASLNASEKSIMKERLVVAGVRTARYFTVYSEMDLKNAVASICYPVIIKAVDLQGSRGINIVKNPNDLIAAYYDTMSLTRKDYCLVEEYIEGKEYGAQAFVYQGRVLFVLPHGDKTIMCKTAVPIGHYMPYLIDNDLHRDTINQVEKAIAALGLDNCAVNVDLIEKEGKAYIIELTGRVGANCLPELVSNYYGINYYEMILAACLGEDPTPLFDKRDRILHATKSQMLFSEKNGTVDVIAVPEIPDCEVRLFVRPGDYVHAFTNSNDAIGEVIVRADSLQECDKLLGEVMSRNVIRLL